MNIEPLKIKRVVASRALLFNKNNELLVVGKNESSMHLPGGWCEEGELVIIACCREVEEETGIITNHQKVIFVEEAITNDSFVENGLLHRVDFFSIITAEDCSIDENFVDHDGGIIQHRKFINEQVWQNSPHIFAPAQLKSLSFQEITNMPSCYSIRTPSC